MTAEDAEGLAGALAEFIDGRVALRLAQERGGLTDVRNAQTMHDIALDQLVATLVLAVPGKHGNGR